jgi:hypothetical protein
MNCPECDALLRSASGFEPGKKVRCPKCKEVITVPEAASRVKTKPTRPAEPDDDDEDRPARKKAAARPERSRRDEDDEDDEDEDDRPRRKGKKGKKEAAGFFTPTRLALLIGGVLVVVGGVVTLILVLNKGEEKPKDGGSKDGVVKDGPRKDGPQKDGAPGDGGIAFDKVLHPGLVNHAASREAVKKLVGAWRGNKGNKSIEVVYRGDGTFKQVIRDGGQMSPFEGTWKLTQVGGNQGGTSRIERKAAIGGGGDAIQLVLEPIGKPSGTITHKDDFDDWVLTKAP